MLLVVVCPIMGIDWNANGHDMIGAGYVPLAGLEPCERLWLSPRLQALFRVVQK